MSTKAEVKFLRFDYSLGRAVAFAQLISEEKVLLSSSLATILLYCETNNVEITNAQAVLHQVVAVNGFGA